jgi:hypothetical protein
MHSKEACMALVDNPHRYDGLALYGIAFYGITHGYLMHHMTIHSVLSATLASGLGWAIRLRYNPTNLFNAIKVADNHQMSVRDKQGLWHAIAVDPNQTVLWQHRLWIVCYVGDDRLRQRLTLHEHNTSKTQYHRLRYALCLVCLC